MKSTFLFCVTAGLLLLNCTCNAQESKPISEDISTGQFLQQTQQSTTDPNPSSLINRNTLVQQGSDNRATVQQMLVGIGRGNTAAVLQSGNNNAVSMLQIGNSNSTSVTQAGSNNQAISSVTGYDTESTIRQRGNGNKVDQQIIRDNQQYVVDQMGNGNTLIQRETLGNTPGYQVSMRGSGITIMIEQGKVAHTP